MDQFYTKLLHPILSMKIIHLRLFSIGISPDELKLSPENGSRRSTFGGLSSYLIPNLGDQIRWLCCGVSYSVLRFDLVDFIETVPPEFLLDLNSMREKHLLYEIGRDLIPDHIYNGHKHPFLSPQWRQILNLSQGKELIETFLSASEIKPTESLILQWSLG